MWKGRPDGRDVRMEGASGWKGRPDGRDARMKGTTGSKAHLINHQHASMLGKEDERHVGAVRINPTEICLNKLASSVGHVIQSTIAVNDGSRFLFNIS
ncbi:hypothetical protein Tco_0793789 [Tanacetum coccineum]